MKRQLTIIFFLLISTIALGQKTIEFKTFSHAEFFKMIEQETDTLFELKNAIIEFRPETDSIYGKITGLKNGKVESYYVRTDTLYINKALRLNNVHFEHSALFGIAGTWNHFVFQKPIELWGTSNIEINHSKFIKTFRTEESRIIPNAYQLGVEWFKKNKSDTYRFGINIDNCIFNQGLRAWISTEKYTYISLNLSNSKIYPNIDRGLNILQGGDIWEVWIEDNEFIGEDYLQIRGTRINNLHVNNNTFNNPVEIRSLQLEGFKSLSITGNEFKQNLIFNSDRLERQNQVEWHTFAGNFVSSYGYSLFRSSLFNNDSNLIYLDLYDNKFINEYKKSFAFQNLKAYNSEISLRGQLKDLYKQQYDNVSANKAYIDIKNLETARLKYLYKQNPTFDTYFQWKVNQFLQLFSDYGTKPSKAIVFSVYVILLFAFIYLFFPNHWDSHGKDRIKHRFLFFYKYLSKSKGIHDVYLEEKKAEIEKNDEFKHILESHKDEAPALFYFAAMPLYRWSIAGTRLYSRLLKRVDFLKGRWKETDPKVRPLQSTLTIILFTIAITYDLFIKVLNAVMLSINTFTTLGFGEIPIKGLPRYLAIIQGFIGWFMLTIFSVSLISQLLN